jgi:hypothetical protein
MIYVDGITEHATSLRYKRWSHLVSDVGADELHAFAVRLGLKRSWSQERPVASAHHYDVTPPKRVLAVKLGALEVTSRELVRRNYDGLTRRGLLGTEARP